MSEGQEVCDTTEKEPASCMVRLERTVAEVLGRAQHVRTAAGTAVDRIMGTLVAPCSENDEAITPPSIQGQILEHCKDMHKLLDGILQDIDRL